MKIYGKILATTLPVVLFFLIGSLAMTYYYSYQGLSGLAEKWLDTRLTEALTEAAEQEEMLRTYGLEDIPASIAPSPKARVFIFRGLMPTTAAACLS